MADASSIRKTTTPLAPVASNPGPNPGSLPSASAAAAGFYESAIRFQLNPVGYTYSFTDSSGATKTRATGQAFINSGAQWVPVGNVVLAVPVQAAADAVDQNIFIADRPYNIVSSSEVHSVIASGAFNVNLTKCTGTQAASAGVAVNTAVFDLNGVAANTVTSGTLSATVANTQLATGDRLALDFTGTATGLAGAVVTVVLQPQ